MSIESVITSKEDPTKLFDLIEELAVGSYGHVYRVTSCHSPFSCRSAVAEVESSPALYAPGLKRTNACEFLLNWYRRSTNPHKMWWR
jgi:hypothetical protein